MIEIPPWVPESVKRAAAAREESRILRQLLFDGRMKSAWRTVLKSQIRSESIGSLSITYGFKDDITLDDRDRAAVALFEISLSDMTDVFKLDNNTYGDWIKTLSQIIEVCEFEICAGYISQIETLMGSCHPRSDQVVADALKATAKYYRRLRDAHQQIGGVRWNHQARGSKRAAFYQERGLEQQPTDGGAVVRAQVTAMIDATDKIFISPLRTPLATIASVISGKNITARQIDNLRANLHRHSPPKSAAEI